MLYVYEATASTGEKQSGSIEAPSMDLAISSLQRRNLIITFVKPSKDAGGIFKRKIGIFSRVKTKDVVILSRQLATLFEAKVPVLESLKLLAAESENPTLSEKLSEILSDIQGGVSLSQAMAKHQSVFSKFYVNMVKIGEESGKIDEILSHLADYLERSYELTTKAKNALMYPAFVIGTFVLIMILMLVMVVPRLTTILGDIGGTLPIYTRILIGISVFFQKMWIFLIIAIIGGSAFLWNYAKTQSGKIAISRFTISFPYIGGIYKKIYLARLTDNMSTLISSGIPMVSSLEITSEVVENEVYKTILLEARDSIKGGTSLSEALSRYKEMPGLVNNMIKVGEEGGKLTFVLATLSRFYKREVDSLIENLVTLIEPAMILILGAAVAFLVMAILGPIYNITSSI